MLLIVGNSEDDSDKGLGINPTLFLHFTFTLQIAGFPWRARQDSNLRPSDSWSEATCFRVLLIVAESA